MESTEAALRGAAPGAPPSPEITGPRTPPPSRAVERQTAEAEPRPVPRARPAPRVRDSTVDLPPPDVARGRGLSPLVAAAGVVAGLAIGFVGGRFTAPSGVVTPAGTPTVVAIATTPEIAETPPATPEETATPTAVVIPRTPDAPATPAPTGKPVVTALAIASATPPAPKATPTAVALVKATPKPPPKVSLADATALVDAGKIDEGIAALEALVKQEPGNGEARWALASAYRTLRKGPKACSQYAGYVKNAPGGAHATDAKRHLQVCEGVALLDKEKLDEAYAAFQAIVTANWTFADGHYWLGTMQALKNENAAACKSFKSYLRLDAKGPYSERCNAQLSALGC